MDEDRWMKYGDIITLQFACSNENAGKGSVGFVSSDGFIAPDLWVHTLTESGNMPPNLHNCCFEITRPFKYTAFKVLQKKLRSQGKTFNSLNDKVLPPTAAARYTESTATARPAAAAWTASVKLPSEFSLTAPSTLSTAIPLVVSLSISPHCRTPSLSHSRCLALTVALALCRHLRCVTHAVTLLRSVSHSRCIGVDRLCPSFQHIFQQSVFSSFLPAY